MGNIGSQHRLKLPIQQRDPSGYDPVRSHTFVRLGASAVSCDTLESRHQEFTESRLNKSVKADVNRPNVEFDSIAGFATATVSEYTKGINAYAPIDNWLPRENTPIVQSR